MSLAKAFVSGVVTKAPEKRFTNNDTPIAGLTINIDQQNETLIRVVVFGQLADTVSNTVALGDTIAVEGKLQVNSFKTPSGKDKRVYEIMANAVEKMNGASNPTQSSSQAVEQSENIVSFAQQEPVEDLIDEDEIPF